VSTAKESEELLTVKPLESLTATVTEKGEPVAVLGAHVIVAEFEAGQPVGSPLHE
jgi:hypothetical protein